MIKQKNRLRHLHAHRRRVIDELLVETGTGLLVADADAVAVDAFDFVPRGPRDLEDGDVAVVADEVVTLQDTVSQHPVAVCRRLGDGIEHRSSFLVVSRHLGLSLDGGFDGVTEHGLEASDDALGTDAGVLADESRHAADDGLSENRGRGCPVPRLRCRTHGRIAGRLHHNVTRGVLKPQTPKHRDSVLGDDGGHVLFLALDEHGHAAGPKGSADDIAGDFHGREDDLFEARALDGDALGDGLDFLVAS